MQTVTLCILTQTFLLLIIHNKVPICCNINEDELKLLSDGDEDEVVTNTSTTTSRNERLRKRKQEQLKAQQEELLQQCQTAKKFKAKDINKSNEIQFVVKKGFLDDNGVLKIDGEYIVL